MFNRLAPLFALTLAGLPLAAQSTPAPPPFVPFSQADHDRYLARGKQVMGWFLEGKADSLLTAFGGEMAAEMSIESIRQQMDGFAERAGVPTRVLVEKMTRRMGTPQFWWEAEVTNFTAEPVVLRWLLNEDLQVVGVGFSPKSRALSDPEG